MIFAAGVSAVLTEALPLYLHIPMKYLLFVSLLCSLCTAKAQLRYTDVSAWPLLHKAQPTARPFQRIDSLCYPDMTRAQKELWSHGAGLAVGFMTDSPTIGIRWTCTPRKALHNASDIAQSGMDLYIRKGGRWIYAGSAVPSIDNEHEALVLQKADSTMKECLLYLPLFREVRSLEIGIAAGSHIYATNDSFARKIVVFGSSITHGIAASRPGMSYVARMSRLTGLDFCNLGISGNCTMTAAQARMIAQTEAEAFVFDCFSNPSSEEIRKRLQPFIDTIRLNHPRCPLIFLQTLFRGTRSFNTAADAFEAAKCEAARKEYIRLLAQGYRDIYLLEPGMDTGEDQEGTTDGTHPNDLGFDRILQNIIPQVTEILARYGIVAGDHEVQPECPDVQPADCKAIRYVGRVDRHGDGSVSFDWSGCYLTLRFTGKSLAMRVSDTGRNYYNVTVDGEFSRVVSTFGRDSSILLASGLSEGIHTLRLQKRTEGREGRTTIHDFRTDAKSGKLLPDTARRVRHIEFIGNSLTCGYGTEGLNRHERFRAETENCDKAYACITARYFDADYTLIAHSGRGVVRNYGDKKPVSSAGTMPERMLRLYDESDSLLWEYSRSPWHPDIVVVNLGTNDFSRGSHPSEKQFKAGYKHLIRTLRKHYGTQVPILCIAPGVRSGIPDRYIREVCREEEDARLQVTTIDPGLCNEQEDLGSDSHPNYTGQCKMAMLLIPYISTMTGWQMPAKPIE